VSIPECKSLHWDDLPDECRFTLPVLKPQEVQTLQENTSARLLYTVLWWWSYKEWWNVDEWWHPAIDIATAKWTPVFAIEDGLVMRAGFLEWYWLSVTIQHEDWRRMIYSAYSHLDTFAVKVGDYVRKWQRIWTVWNTWNSMGMYGNHLDFQIITSPIVQWPYWYADCPGLYNNHVNDWTCRETLALNTIDPLVFFQQKWVVWTSTFEQMQRYRETTTFTLPVINKSSNPVWTTNVTVPVSPSFSQSPSLSQSPSSSTATSQSSSAQWTPWRRAENEWDTTNSSTSPLQSTIIPQRITTNQRPVTLPNWRVLPIFNLYHAPNTTNNRIVSRTTQTQTVVQTTAPQTPKPQATIKPWTAPAPAPAPTPTPTPTPTPAPTPSPAPTPAPTPALTLASPTVHNNWIPTHDGLLEIMVVPTKTFVDVGSSITVDINVRTPDGVAFNGILPWTIELDIEGTAWTAFPSSLSFLQNWKRSARIEGKSTWLITVHVIYKMQKIHSFSVHGVQ
jgi:hypothetical protein